jgi:hypothetical protein
LLAAPPVGVGSQGASETLVGVPGQVATQSIVAGVRDSPPLVLSSLSSARLHDERPGVPWSGSHDRTPPLGRPGAAVARNGPPKPRAERAYRALSLQRSRYQTKRQPMDNPFQRGPAARSLFVHRWTNRGESTNAYRVRTNVYRVHHSRNAQQVS